MQQFVEPTQAQLMVWVAEDFLFLLELGISCFILGFMLEMLWKKKRK